MVSEHEFELWEEGSKLFYVMVEYSFKVEDNCDPDVYNYIETVKAVKVAEWGKKNLRPEMKPDEANSWVQNRKELLIEKITDEFAARFYDRNGDL